MSTDLLDSKDDEEWFEAFEIHHRAFLGMAPIQRAPHVIDPGGHVLHVRHSDGIAVAVGVSRGIMGALPGCFLQPVSAWDAEIYRCTLPSAASVKGAA